MNSNNTDSEEFELDSYYDSPEYIGSPEYRETVEMLRESLDDIQNGEVLFSNKEVFTELRAK